MCLVVLNWRPDAVYPLILVANRDEFRARPTKAMHWWQKPELLAGRDLEAGGTWFAIDRSGRFALVTNIRPGYLGKSSELSRGNLPVEFIQTGLSIEQYHRRVLEQIDPYGGFNLILGEPGKLFWFNSDSPQGSWVSPGVHALCNDALDTPWPKSLLAMQQIQAQTLALEYGDRRGDLLDRTELFEDQQLPETGLSLERERMLSAQKIVGSEYGTRCRTWLRLSAAGKIWVDEAQLDQSGVKSSERNFHWSIEP